MKLPAIQIFSVPAVPIPAEHFSVEQTLTEFSMEFFQFSIFSTDCLDKILVLETRSLTFCDDHIQAWEHQSH